MLSTQIRPAQPGLFIGQTLGVDDFELSQIAAEFSTMSSGELEHHLFDAPRPSEIVRLADKVARHTRSHGWLDQAAAQARIAEWKRHAFAQGEGRANADKVVLSLFDHTGHWSQPWEDAGYQVLRFDIQDNPVTGDVNEFGAGFFGDWFGDFCRFQKATAPVHWAGRRVCIELLTGNGQKFYARSAARDRNCSELLCTARQSRNRRKFRRSTGKLLDALGQAAESLVHVFQHLGFCALRAQRVFEGFQVGQPLPMQAAQLVELRPEVLETAARTKRLVATLKRGRRGQQLRAHLLVLFGELGHAVIGPRSLAALGFGCLFHDAGVAVEPWELAGQRHELLIGCADPNPVQVRPVPHHAIDDGMGLADTLGGKLLHVLVDLRGQSAEFVHAHVRHKRRVDCPCAVRSATAFLSKETKVSPPSQLPS